MNLQMKKFLMMAVALVATTPAFAVNTPADFHRDFNAVSCIGHSEFWWRNPVYEADGGSRAPDQEPVNLTITTTATGWKVTGSYRFDIKRWKRTSTGGYPLGSVSWDDEGIWAHYILLFGDKGEVTFEKHSRRGVEVTFADCTYSLQ